MPYYDYRSEFNSLITNTETIISNQEEVIINQGVIYNSLNTISLLIVLMMIIRLIRTCFGGTK